MKNQSTELPERLLALRAHDSARVTHWVTSRSVVHVSAAHQYTNIHCRDRLIHLRASFTEVLKQLDDVVVRVHRSHAVNPLYVSHLENEVLYLTTGAQVPIPVRRAREIRLMLAERTAQVDTGD